MHKLTVMFQLFAPVTAELELFMSSKDVHEKPAIVLDFYQDYQREFTPRKRENFIRWHEDSKLFRLWKIQWV